MKLKTLVIVLTFFIAAPAFAQQSAFDIMQQAEKQAVKQNKEVFLLFHASWCGWCKRMDKKMSAPSTKAYFDNHFIITHVTVLETKKNKNLENPGGMELLKKYKGQKAGLPFWVILNKDGKMLTNSYDSGNSNLGCPASKKEVATFVNKLKANTNINPKQQKAVADAFILKK